MPAILRDAYSRSLPSEAHRASDDDAAAPGSATPPDGRDPFDDAEIVGALLGTVPVFAAVLDADGRIVRFNRECEKLSGRKTDEVMGMFFWSLFVRPEEQRSFAELFRKIIVELPTDPFERTWHTSAGELKHTRWRITPLHCSGDATCGLLAVGTDLTPEVRAREAIRASEERFSIAFFGAPDPYVIADFETGEMIEVNDAFTRVFGWTREEALGKRGSQLHLWVDLEQRNRFAAEIHQRGSVSEMEQLRRTRSGDVLVCLVSAFCSEVDGQKRVLYRMRDITRERMAEIALLESEEKFSKAFRSTPDAFTICTLDEGQIIEVNEGFTHLYGWSREEAVGRTGLELGLWLSREDRENIAARLRDHRALRDFPVTMLDREGRRHHCVYSAESTEIGGQRCIIANIRDVTEQQRLEEQLRHAQRMESVGQLAGGVAHDFNNILTVIHAHASLLTSRRDLTDAAYDSLRQIQQSAAFAANLTRQLLVFSRKQVMQRTTANLNDIVSRMGRLLRRVLSEAILLELKPRARLPEMSADVGMIEQVLLNLVVNARDAMPRGGRLVVQTLSLRTDAAYLARVPQARQGRFVGLRVRDNGTGIPVEIQPRIFDPFFTTKVEGEGTGLGLSTVYGIVQQHEGWIEVDSHPGKGAEFTAWFPASPTAHVAEDTPGECPNAPCGHETILVAEDKDSVRQVLKIAFEQHGYRPLMASDAAEALEIWAHHRQEIALLFTDVIMPGGMTGRDLAEHLRVDRPELRVVFCSGYGIETLGPDEMKNPANRFLAKPFDVDELATTVREILDADVP